MKVTILGSGTSKGVPEARCQCKVCRSKSHYDKRLRSSALVETGGLKILIDAGPDFRYQALSNEIDRIDAVLITHTHYDHVGGLDDLRPYCWSEAIAPTPGNEAPKGHSIHLPIYIKEEMAEGLFRHFDYCFRDKRYPGAPALDMLTIPDEPFFIKNENCRFWCKNGVKIIPINVNHGEWPIFGYRIGNFAYLTDVKTIPEEEYAKLEGLEVLVLNALRFKTHFAHLSVGEALDIVSRIKPKKTYLTHFNHEIGLHKDFEKQLPPSVYPAYDGLKIKI